MNFLNLFVIIPMLTMVAVIFAKDMKHSRVIAVIGMTLQVLLSIYLVYAYFQQRALGDTAQMLFYSKNIWYESLNITYTLGVDAISVWMILMLSIVILASVLVSWNIEYLHREFYISLIFLATGSFGFFITTDLFTMFLFYEAAVIPKYLLIGIYGTGRKEYSAMKLTLMLMGGSALVLVGILGIYFFSAPEGGKLTFDILEIAKHNIPFKVQMFFYPFLFVGFGLLSGLFPLHSWSPDGHSSAPTAVSMLSAGVIMKLGGYGIIRVAMTLMPHAAHEYCTLFLILAAFGVTYGAFAAIVAKDLKYINAYSSVSHCGLVLFGLLMMNKTAMNGAVLQMISHGFMTALFFALIGMIYSRTHTRMVDQMGGLLKVIPFIGVAYVIAGLASLGLPGFSGFVAEMNVFFGAFEHTDTFTRVLTIIAISSIVVTAVYILRVVGLTLMGSIKNEHHEHLTDAVWWEKLVVVMLIVCILVMGTAPFWISSSIADSLTPIVTKLSMLN